KTQILVSPKDVKSYPLITVTPQDIARPNRLVCHKEVCYYLARDQLYQFEAQQLKNWQPPQPLIQSRKFRLKTGETIRELSDLTINAQGHVFLLDKSNDIYRYESSSQAWRMEWKSAPYHKQPDPHFIS